MTLVFMFESFSPLAGSIPALRRVHLVEQPTRFCLALEQSDPGISQLGMTEEFSTGEFRLLYGTTKLASEMLIEGTAKRSA